ncbi:hypothetical protein D3C72_319560 [compost metagenome]
MRQNPEERGIAILWAVSAITVTTVLIATAFSLVQAERSRSTKRMLRAQAESLSLSGLHFALAQLNKDSNFGGVETESWKIQVTKPGLPPPVTSPDYRLETNRTEDWRNITVQTTIGKHQSTRDALAVSIYHPRYPAGILATDHLSVQGIETDSYDGQNGDYRATQESFFGQLWSFGNLEIIGGATSSIYGNCSAFGRLSIDSTFGGIQINGSTRSLEVRYPVPILTPPPKATPLKISPGTTKSVASGKYVIDRLNLPPSTRLICEGMVEIYANDVAISPLTLITLEKDPMALKLIITGSTAEISAPFTGIIDASQANVKLTGNGDFFGAVLAARVMVEPGIRLHFDRSLPRRSRYSLLRWELAN